MEMKLFFGLDFTGLTVEEIVNEVVATNKSQDEELKLLITTNVDHLVTMKKNQEFKTVCEHAWILTADGFPVHKFLKFMGHGVKGRITGADLFPEIMNNLNSEHHSPFFVVANQSTAHYLVTWLAERNYSNPEDRVVVPDFGFEKDEQYTQELLDTIAQNNVSHLFFGVGAPKSELWLYKNKNHLKGVKGFGFGAGIDFFAGVTNRAPLWMQKNGVEWAFRLSTEPKRLAKRYLVSSWGFALLAFNEYKLHRGTDK